MNQPRPSESPSPQPDADALALLKRPDLLDCFLEDTGRLGCVGEEPNKTLLYLALTSRLLDNPINIIVRGESASGKSRQVLSIAKFFPHAEVITLSSMSAKALFHYKGPLAHKVLMVMEHAGVEAAQYPIRTLLSEGGLNHFVTMQSPSGAFESQVMEVKGPISFVVTTNLPGLDQQNENRCFVIRTDESEEQTKRILEAQRGRYLRADDNSPPRLAVWCCAQGLLKRLPVRIPFADLIQFPTTPLRVRRDQPRFLAIIEANALLHQFQRPVTEQRGKKCIEAVLADYEVAYRMALHHLPGLIGALSKKAEELLKMVEGHRKLSNRFTTAQLREWLKWDRKTVIKYREEAVKAGYIEVVSESPGMITLYELAKVYEKGRLLILSPDKLREKLEVAGRQGNLSAPTESRTG